MRRVMLLPLLLVLVCPVLADETDNAASPPPADRQATGSACSTLGHSTTAEPKDRQTRVYRLENAPVMDVARAIDDYLKKEHGIAVESQGVVIESPVVLIPEQVSNSLIVAAQQRYAKNIADLIASLDVRPTLVMIQAKISLTDGDGKVRIVSRPQIMTIDRQNSIVEVALEDKRKISIELRPHVVVPDDSKSDEGQQVSYAHPQPQPVALPRTSP